MRGTILLIDAGTSSSADIDLMRANGLLVHQCGSLSEAVTRIRQDAPDVVVVRLPADASQSVLPALREAADYATSIIVSADPAARDASRDAGADAFLPSSVPLTDLLYEIHRALILRRSGRRLPRNW